MYTSEDLYLNHSLNRAHIVSCLLPLMSVVSQPVMSDHGLLTTVAYKLGRDKPACYALEVQRPEYTHVPLFLSFLIVQFTATFFFFPAGFCGHRGRCGPLAAGQPRDHRIVRRARYVLKTNQMWRLLDCGVIQPVDYL